MEQNTIKRDHPLTVGEVVFDLNQNYYGVITRLEDGKATINMCAEGTYPKEIHAGWCELENRMMFDDEVENDPVEWETDDLDALYQVAWGVTDLRTGNIVCYEHVCFEDGYPYYSPYLEENLFRFEVDER